MFEKVVNRRPLIQANEIRVSEQPVQLDYSVSEMLTQVEFDLPMQKEKKEKLDNERILLKQLLANIERNRVKWRKDVFESDSLSIGRKVALQGVKDRIDQQAHLLAEEEIETKERSNDVRRQIEQLSSLKNKLDAINRERENDRKEALMKDARVSFDKYLRFYAKDSKHLKRQRRDWHLSEKAELASFKSKWADFLVDEHEGDDDIRPMLGLD